MPTSLFCELWKKAVETPQDPEFDRQIDNLTNEQITELGTHAKTCPGCQKLFEAHENDLVDEDILGNLTSPDQLPLAFRILLKAEEEVTPEEKAFHEMAINEQIRETAEIETAVQTFVQIYPGLDPANFGISHDVPLRAMWNVCHFLMLLARRFCRHDSPKVELKKVRLLPDGSMIINDKYLIASEICRAEACATASNVSVVIDDDLAQKIICWLSAASQAHSYLLDPDLNKLDHTGQKDFLAPWRV